MVSQQAHRLALRQSLRDSTSLSLMQDVRDGQLLVSFVSVDTNLKVTNGHLGQCNLHDFGLTAKDIAQASVYILHKFATAGLGMPVRDGSADNAILDHDLVQHVKSTVECFGADGAADEQRAGQLLKRWFPALKLVQFDKAHACQRLLSRTFPADPYINKLVQDLVLGPQAITQKIRYSGVFRKRFQEAVAELSGPLARRIRDLACAKHRFLSAAQPFRRSVLYFQPLLRVAQWIVQQRGKGSEEGQIARQWLKSVTAESAFQLALVADSTDETMAVNRYFDQDTYSKADLTVQLHKFLQKCSWLFGPQRGAMQTGYTSLMMKTLEKPCNILIDGTVTSVRAPSNEVIDRCFQRMQNWLELVRMTVRAEMPHFESVQLFRVFSLDMSPNMKDLECLANMIELDPDGLRTEFLDLRPSAEWHFANGSKSSEDAWRASHLKNRTTASPKHNLEAALTRLFSWQINTCGIERAFAKGLVQARKRGDVSEHRLDDEVQLLSLNKGKGKLAALPKHSDLIESARAVWTQCYGPPRNRQKVSEDLRGWVQIVCLFFCFPFDFSCEIFLSSPPVRTQACSAVR